jgi:asparagine synthetase B (glutamine-hydrolysing)
MAAQRHSSVVLTGYGGDPALLPGAVIRQIGRGPTGLLLGDIGRSLRRRKRPPLGLKSGLLRRLRPGRESVPGWLSRRLLDVYDPTATWATHLATGQPGREARTEALQAVDHWVWAWLFEGYDPGATNQPVEVRYPFFDERVVAAALALPSYPWCIDKTILRDAMARRLPPAILTRPKAPLADEPLGVRAWPAERAIARVEQCGEMAAFVDLAAFRRTVSGADRPWTARPGAVEAVALATWLRLEAESTPRPSAW